MLCPEVWDFKPPDSTFKIEKGSLADGNCKETINNFYYNHLVSIVLPDTLHVPGSITDLFTTDCDYYKIPNFSIQELVNKDFIDSFVRKGSLTVLSLDTRIDCDNCVSVTPEGILILSLNKETYQSLGLEGRPSHFHRNSKNRYIVHINLLLESLKPGKKYYARVKTALEKLKNVTALINWEPPDDRICPSSIAKYFYDLNYNVKSCTSQYKTRTEYSVKTPVFNIEDVELSYTYELTEWLGMLKLQGDLESGSPDNYLSTYTVLEPNEQYGQLRVVEGKGFFTVEQVERIYNALEKYVCNENKPWVSLYVQGFSDSPVNWKLREHHYFTNGDNSYTIWMDSTNYLLCKQMSSFKTYK